MKKALSCLVSEPGRFADRRIANQRTYRDRVIFKIRLLSKNELSNLRMSVVPLSCSKRPAECHNKEPSSFDGEDSDWTSSSGDSSADSSTNKEEANRLLVLVQISIAEIYWDVDAFTRFSDTERQEGRRNIMHYLASISDLIAQKSVARRPFFKRQGT